MKQTIEIEADDIPPEIDFSGGVRGRFSGRIVNGARAVVIEPELAKVFPTTEAVNQALRALAEASKGSVVKPRRRESAPVANQTGKTRGRKAS